MHADGVTEFHNRPCTRWWDDVVSIRVLVLGPSDPRPNDVYSPRKPNDVLSHLAANEQGAHPAY